MDCSPRFTTMLDGRDGVSWLTPTLHKGRVLDGHYDVHVRPATPEESILRNLENLNTDDDI